MKKVYQTIMDPKKGNCMQAAYATLFNLELDQVPNFILYEDRWFGVLWEFLKTQGVLYSYSVNNNRAFDVMGDSSGDTAKKKDRFPEIKKREGVNGLYAAVVFSPRYFDMNAKVLVSHQVLIDSDFNIVFDPNPQNKGIFKYPLADEMGYNGVKSVEFYEPYTPEVKI